MCVGQEISRTEEAGNSPIIVVVAESSVKEYGSRACTFLSQSGLFTCILRESVQLETQT